MTESLNAPVVVLAPNPSIFTGAGTNTYLVGASEMLCIDPGPDDDRHLEAILACVAERDAHIAAILLTHSHPDHRPLARRLAEATGAPVHACDASRGDDGARPMGDSAVVGAGRLRLRAVHTPGHASDHLCYFDEREAALYTGDHVLSGTTTVISPPDGDMTAYMASLQRIRELRPRVIYPGHGLPVEDAVGLIDEYLAHRRDREAQVENAARQRGTAVAPADLVPEIYAGYPAALQEIAAHSVEAHLDKLAREGRAVRTLVSGEPRYLVR
jgi:glyoxylase-like metal-dependent hydrolase (beta-lactamase superfamily II)